MKKYSKSEALKQLEKQAYQHKLESSSMPSYAVPKPKYSDRTSNGLTKCIIAYLTLLGGWASRINTTGRYLKGKQVTDVLGHTQRTKGKWIPGTTKTGTPDIIGDLNGSFIGIEVKIGRDKLSDRQQAVQSKIQESGGVLYCCQKFYTV